MQRAISLAILVVLVVLLAFLFYQVMIGFLLPLFLAALLAILFQPLHSRMVQLFRGHDRLAAGITTTVILLIVLAPLAFIVLRASHEAIFILNRAGGPHFNEQTLDRIVNDLNHRFSLDLSSKDLIQTASMKAQDWFGPVAAKTPGFLGSLMINCLVTVLGLYYFLADGTQLTASTMGLLPLDQKYQKAARRQVRRNEPRRDQRFAAGGSDARSAARYRLLFCRLGRRLPPDDPHDARLLRAVGRVGRGLGWVRIVALFCRPADRGDSVARMVGHRGRYVRQRS